MHPADPVAPVVPSATTLACLACSLLAPTSLLERHSLPQRACLALPRAACSRPLASSAARHLPGLWDPLAWADPASAVLAPMDPVSPLTDEACLLLPARLKPSAVSKIWATPSLMLVMSAT